MKFIYMIMYIQPASLQHTRVPLSLKTGKI